MKSDVERFTTYVQTCQQPDLVQDRFDDGGKTPNITFRTFKVRVKSDLKTVSK